MRTFRALLAALEEMEGVPFAEIASRLGREWPDDPAKRKSLAGQLVEQALGKAADASHLPDLRDLGLEVKTIPLRWKNNVLDVREDTSITTSDTLPDLVRSAWRQSRLYEKLRTTLFVPIMKHDLSDPDLWYVRSPFIWLPSVDVEKQLTTDYATIREHVVRRLVEAEGTVGALDALGPEAVGVYIRLGSKGRGHGERRKYEVESLGTFSESPRGWYLRKAFTRVLIGMNVAFRPGSAPVSGDEVDGPVDSTDADV